MPRPRKARARNRGPREKKPRDSQAAKNPRAANSSGPTNNLGTGPIGAMTRWARFQKRSSFVLSIPSTPPEDNRVFKGWQRRARHFGRRGSVALSKRSLRNYSDEQRKKLTQETFNIADLPTNGLESLIGLMSGKLPASLVSSAIVSLVYGLPLALADESLLEQANNLITLRLTFRNPGDELGVRLSELTRVSANRMAESYMLAERPLLTLGDMSREIARPATLQNKLRRLVDTRRNWLEKGLERHYRILRVAEGEEKVNFAFIDLLPLIVARVNDGNIRQFCDALMTPLGVMVLGLCPCFVLPEAKVTDA